MKQTISLSRREIEQVYKLFNLMNETGDYGRVTLVQDYSVTLVQEGDNGIGTILKAIFLVTHKENEGEFCVTITDEENW